MTRFWKAPKARHVIAFWGQRPRCVFELYLSQRGQARLPDHELIADDFRLLGRKSFKTRLPTKTRDLSGWEGGLAPAHLLALKG